MPWVTKTGARSCFQPAIGNGSSKRQWMSRALSLAFEIVFASSLMMMPACRPVSPSEPFHFEVGDILFQDLDCGPLCDAIEAVTQGAHGASLSHVAIVSRVQDGDVWVIEAYAQGVVEVPVQQLLSRSHDAQGQPKVLVGRLRPPLRHLISPAIQAARKRLGMPYDEAFMMNNGAYYCSELLYDIFVEANAGQAVFELQPMTFRKPGSSYPHQVWQAYFEKRKEPVPEGKPGLNPGGMSRSSAIRIVSALGAPAGWRR